MLLLLVVFMFIVLEALQNGKGVITGGMLTSNVETEKGLLTLITTDAPGIQVCDPNGHWYLEDDGSSPGDLLLLSGRSLSHATAGLRPVSSYRAATDNTLISNSGGRTSLAFRLMSQSNAILDCSSILAAGHVIPQSRFGKFVEIQFDHKGRISGAAIRTYLLERSRVCQLSDLERNYHCFYMLCAAPQEELQKYKLENPRTFHYLNQSNCYEIYGLDESKEYAATKRAMDVVGISSEEQSKNGGLAAWEPAGSSEWLELLNPTEFFADIVIEHEYVECTSSAIQAMVMFKKSYPGNRKKEIEGAILNAVQYLEGIQMPDGSWYVPPAKC